MTTVGDQPVRFGEPPVPGSPDQDEALREPQPEELAGASPLELLRKVVAEDVKKPPITLDVPMRPGVAITYDCTIDNDLLTAWQDRAMYQDQRKGADPLKYAAIVLSNQCVGFEIGGAPVRSGGQPLTFASSEVWQMVNPPATNAIEAVKRLYGVDAHVILAGEEVLRAAGYGDKIRQVERDPTVPPSMR